MKPTSLKALIAQHAGTRTVLTTPQASLAFGDLVALHWTGEDGAAVAIFCADLANTMRAMVALDGCAAAICALPTDLSKDDLTALLNQWPFDCVITDMDAQMCAAFAEHGIRRLTVEQAISSEAEVTVPDVVTKWLVPTSGTTSTPKLVVHTMQSLARTALTTAKATEPPQVWALVYDITRFAGYQVFFQSLLSGHTLAFAGLATSVTERIEFYVRVGVTHISATPTLWRKILMSPASKQLAPTQITLGGEAADQPVLTSLTARYPDARITHIYASTEAGVGLAVSDSLAGFPLAYTNRAYGGVEVRLADDKLMIRTETGPSGYAGGRDFAGTDGWVDTGDLTTVDGDRFYIIGRESGVINVGGDKVVPEHIRDALLKCEIVQEAVVFGKKNPFTGALVAADVVLSEPLENSEARKIIDAFLATHLTPNQRPRVLRFVTEIAANSTGKVMSK